MLLAYLRKVMMQEGLRTGGCDSCAKKLPILQLDNDDAVIFTKSQNRRAERFVEIYGSTASPKAHRMLINFACTRLENGDISSSSRNLIATHTRAAFV